MSRLYFLIFLFAAALLCGNVAADALRHTVNAHNAALAAATADR